MRRFRGSGGLIGRALALLGWAVLALIAGIGLAFDRWPVATSVGAVLFVGLLILGSREASKAKALAFNARMRDEHVPSMSPLEYEQFVARQLQRAGWKVRHCGRSGDQGADVVAERSGFRAVVQCKLYRNRVGNAAIQEVAAARHHYGAQIMVVVAPAGFTRAAEQLAASNGVHLLHHSALGALATAARIP